MLFEDSIAADADGYAEALRLRETRSWPACIRDRGHGVVGAGLSRFLLDHDEQVFEVGRPRRERRQAGRPMRSTRSGLPAACSCRSAVRYPGAAGEREALRALMAAREGAAIAKRPASTSSTHCLSRRPSRFVASSVV